MSQLPTSSSFPQTLDVTFFLNLKRNHIIPISVIFSWWKYIRGFGYVLVGWDLSLRILKKKKCVLHLPTHKKISLYLKEYYCIEKQISRKLDLSEKSKKVKGEKENENKRENQYGWEASVNKEKKF